MPSRLLYRLLKRSTVLGATLLGIAATVPSAEAQPVSGDPSQGVYVRDSAIAADKFELGKRMERLKEWPKSADVYQEILEKYQDRVVPTVLDDKSNPIQYASVTVAVQQRLARWPAEGLAVYRARFEPVATVALEQVGPADYAALHRIFSLYFVTDSARQAGLRLMDLYLESGEFAAAAWIGQHLLEWHPNLAADRPLVLFRTALAYHLAGSPAPATRFLDELKTNHPNEQAAIAGRQVILLEALSQQLRQKPPIAVAAGGDGWPMVGGDRSRSLISGAAGNPGAKVYSIDLPGPIVDNLNEQNKRALLDAHNNARNLGMTINVIPAVDRGELFFQDGQRVYALHLESGVPLAGWTQTYGGNRMGQYWLPNAAAALMNLGGEVVGLNAAVPRQHTLMLTDDAVLAVMGQSGGRNPFGPQVANAGGTRLVCLDRATGKQRWIVAPRNDPADQANSRNLDFSGSPLVGGDNVYVIARGGTGAGVEDCHVLCYNLASGELRWSCYIASSQSGGMNPQGLPLAVDDDTLSHLAFASGRIFVLTNLGAVAAIDAYSGATAWLSIYPRDDSNLDRQQRMMRGWGWNPGLGGVPGRQGVRPWEFNPVMVSEGKVFILPLDGRFIHVYDAGTGNELKRIPRQIDFANKARKLTMLLAAAGERLLVAGDDVILHLNWSTYRQPENNPRTLDEQSVLYPGDFADAMLGRPFVTADRIYVPLKTHLSVVDRARSRVTERFPRNPGVWPPEEGPGNVVVAEGHVIVANARGIAVYTDLEGVRQRYFAALQANPRNVEARLVFCELMFNAREYADALTAMDDAINLLGGLPSLRPGALRDRLFSDAILFAQRIGADKDAGGIALADKLYDRAAAAADNPGQHVTYRMSRARFLESLPGTRPGPDVARAVRLYQEILNDPRMRAIGLAGDDDATVFAAKKAEDAITGILLRTDRSIYQPFEQQAAAALAALAQTQDANQLLALSEQYPHADAAARALMQAADLYETGGNPRMATLVLRRLYWKYERRYQGDAKAVLVEAMARNYLKAGNLGAALGRLQSVAKALPAAKLTRQLLTPDGQPLATPQGQPVQTLSQATAALELYARQRSVESLPDVHLPTPPTPEDYAAGKPRPEPFLKPDPDSVVINVQAILRPPVDLPDFNRHDRLVIWSAGKLVCLSPAAKDAHWLSPALTANPIGLAWIDKNLLVWSLEEVAMLDGQSGKLQWKADLRTLPAPAVADDANEQFPSQPNPQPDPPAAAEAQIREIQIREQQIAIRQRLNLRGGIQVAAPMIQLPAQQAPAINEGREYIIHARPVSDRLILATSTGRVAALDLAGGRPLWQSRLSRGTVIRQTLASDEFTVLRALEGQIAQLVVLDTYSGQPILRKKFPGAANWPLTCALSSSGMLVWTTQQTLAAKDLYESGEQPTWSVPGLSFANIVQPDQLLIWNENVLALCNNGVFVARRHLRSGDEIPAASLLNSGTADENAGANVRLRLAGPRLYVVSGNKLISYDLEQDTSVVCDWSDLEATAPEIMLTKAFVILPGLMKKASIAGLDSLITEDRPPTETTYAVQAYSRNLIRNEESGKLVESGRLDYPYAFDQPAKVKNWQAVEGGIYYLSGDNKLHLLKGARP